MPGTPARQRILVWEEGKTEVTFGKIPKSSWIRQTEPSKRVALRKSTKIVGVCPERSFSSFCGALRINDLGFWSAHSSRVDSGSMTSLPAVDRKAYMYTLTAALGSVPSSPLGQHLGRVRAATMDEEAA